jgi:hypothetical protein
MGLKYNLDGRSSVNLGYGIHNQIQTVYNYFIQTPTALGTEYTNKNMVPR